MAMSRSLGGRSFTRWSPIRMSSVTLKNMAAIVKAYHDTGFTGYVRPDHGRMIWGEQGKAGYGLYDRALGAVYLNGLWEAIDKFADQPAA